MPAFAVPSLASAAFAQAGEVGGEANLKLPDLSQVTFLGVDGHRLLTIGILFCLLGLGFGLTIYVRLKNLPVHRACARSRADLQPAKLISLLKKFLLILKPSSRSLSCLLWGAAEIRGGARCHHPAFQPGWIAGSYGVVVRIRSNFANSRTAFAGWRKAVSHLQHSAAGWHEYWHDVISVELLIMLFILLFVPRDYAGPCFISFAIGESLGAAAVRIAGSIFTKIADIGSDLMKIVFKIKEDDARNRCNRRLHG
jgi:K(+)-stimulated pyrophosphate-energized sodium pump